MRHTTAFDIDFFSLPSLLSGAFVAPNAYPDAYPDASWWLTLTCWRQGNAWRIFAFSANFARFTLLNARAVNQFLYLLFYESQLLLFPFLFSIWTAWLGLAHWRWRAALKYASFACAAIAQFNLPYGARATLIGNMYSHVFAVSVSALLSWCPNVHLSVCPDVPLSRWPDVQVSASPCLLFLPQLCSIDSAQHVILWSRRLSFHSTAAETRFKIK